MFICYLPTVTEKNILSLPQVFQTETITTVKETVTFLDHWICPTVPPWSDWVAQFQEHF